MLTCYEEIDVDELVEEIVTTIQRPQQADADDTDPSGYMEPGTLPGFGQRDDCGQDEISYFCTGCGSVTSVSRTCYQSIRPRCAPMWVVEAAVPNLAQLQNTAKMMSARLGGKTEYQ